MINSRCNPASVSDRPPMEHFFMFGITERTLLCGFYEVNLSFLYAHILTLNP
jgi:hypothetical protein